MHVYMRSLIAKSVFFKWRVYCAIGASASLNRRTQAILAHPRCIIRVLFRDNANGRSEGWYRLN